MIFSSLKPRVSKTRPQSSSLNAIPFCVPPHALYSQSAKTVGMPSDRTSCMNAFLLSVVPFDPAERLNASLIRRSSFSLTRIQRRWNQIRFICSTFACIVYICMMYECMLFWLIAKWLILTLLLNIIKEIFMTF